MTLYSFYGYVPLVLGIKKTNKQESIPLFSKSNFSFRSECLKSGKSLSLVNSIR